MFRKRLRCDCFLTMSAYKKKHDFLKHYNEGEDDLFEDKPIDIENTANLVKFEITVNKQGECYDFENSRKLLMIFKKM